MWFLILIFLYNNKQSVCWFIFQAISIKAKFLGKSARFAYSQGLVRFCVCLCVCVCVCLSVKIVSTAHTLAKIKNIKNAVCRFRHLPWNRVIAKIALRDFDLLFGGKQFKIVISLKQ